MIIFFLLTIYKDNMKYEVKGGGFLINSATKVENKFGTLKQKLKAKSDTIKAKVDDLKLKRAAKAKMDAEDKAIKQRKALYDKKFKEARLELNLKQIKKSGGKHRYHSRKSKTNRRSTGRNCRTRTRTKSRSKRRH